MNSFSFIIPAYNCEQYLSECICSIEKVGLQNYEILLINDGSTDGTGTICNELTHQNERIKCFHQKNQGVSAARNNGLKWAAGDYVIFLDADDRIEPERMYRLLRSVAENPDIDMAIFGLSFDYYYRGNCYRSDELGLPFCGKIESSVWIEHFRELYLQNAWSPIWNKVIRRSMLVDNQLKLREDMFLYEDLEFSLRCMAHCNSIYFCPEIIYHYRQAEDEGNAGRRLRRIEHIPVLIDKIEAALDELISKQYAGEKREQIKNILVALYLVLAREKITVSNKREIRQICNDFSDWMERKQMQVPECNQEYAALLLDKKVIRLLLKRFYTQIRHKTAVWMKNAQWYQNI